MYENHLELCKIIQIYAKTGNALEHMQIYPNSCQLWNMTARVQEIVVPSSCLMAQIHYPSLSNKRNWAWIGCGLVIFIVFSSLPHGCQLWNRDVIRTPITAMGRESSDISRTPSWFWVKTLCHPISRTSVLRNIFN